jgi:hypothetical protein
MTHLLNADPFPLANGIPAAQKPEIKRCWEDLYGGWRGL